MIADEPTTIPTTVETTIKPTETAVDPDPEAETTIDLL